MSTPDQTPALQHESSSEAVTRPPALPRPAGNETEDYVAAADPAESPTLSPDSVELRQIGADGIRIPGYEILATLGRGGMGVVYQARQTKLGRVVALKMILAGAHASEAELARFRTEAEAIARLPHPNIVQIYEIGEHSGLPYIALEFCDGGSLEKKLSGTPLPAQEAAALVEALARAMAAAHHKGVIHRDLKPANVLLAEDGTPKITDFGLAKKLDEAGQTASGAIMGTPSYMAPEQAGGQSALVGPPCDIYALGAILYECLTGRPPFKAATALDTMMQVVSDEPAPPSRLQTKTPRDLETICLKCLHKEAGKRYATAQDLADDLQRFLNGEPIRARPVGRIERAAKWVKRNPMVAALAALVVLSLLGGASGIIVKYRDAKEQEGIAKEQEGIAREQEGLAQRKAKEAEDALKERNVALKRARDDAEAARKATGLAEERKSLAEKRQEETQYQLAVSNVLLAQSAWDSNNETAARTHLEVVPPSLRRWEWHYLNRRFQGWLFSFFSLQAPGDVLNMAFSPDGKRLATAGSNGEVRFWDACTGRIRTAFHTGHKGSINCLAFSSDGTLLATASQEGTARLWNARTGQLLREFKCHTGAVRSVAFSPDGMRLATASNDKTAQLWDVQTGRLLAKCKGHTGFIASVAFSPNNTRLATASEDGTARLWDARTGLSLRKFKGHTDPVHCVVFSPNGTQLATASIDGTARLWDAQTGQQLLDFAGGTSGVAFSPDGTRLVTAGAEAARLWDVRTGRQLFEYKVHTRGFKSVAFSTDGARLATVHEEGIARLWDARTGQFDLECKSDTLIHRLAFSPDGRRLATTSDSLFSSTAQLWDVPTGQLLREFKVHNAGVSGLAFSPDGARLATVGNDKKARLWDADTGRKLLECNIGREPGHFAAFSPDGTRLAAAGWQGAQLWDARTGQLLREYKGQTGPNSFIAFSPDGTRLAAAGGKGAQLWDVRTGQLLREYNDPTGTGAVRFLAFSPDGTRLATAGIDGTARLWDVQKSKQIQVFRGHKSMVHCLAFSPDGTRLATASGKTAWLWDVRTGQPLVQWTRNTDVIIPKLAFSPNGAWLAIVSANSVRLLDARPRSWPWIEELRYRLWATRDAPDWHEEQFHKFQGSDRFAAAFHLDRLLAYRPAQRARLLRQRTQYLTETLKKDAKNADARLLLARTAWHSPTLGPKDAAALLPLADEKGLLMRRTRTGLLLRQHKAAETVSVLEAALKDRGDDQPPVEELLLAWAYHDTKHSDKAKALWTKATAWLDRGQEAVRAANVVGTLPGGVLAGVTSLIAPTVHPCFNAFDWETWHELDVLCRELAPRFVSASD